MTIVVFVLLVVGFIYRSWFTPFALSSGDWPYLFLENIKEFSWLPEIKFLWLAPYYQILTKIAVEYLRIPWEITEKLFWFFPFIVLSLISSYKLTKSALGALIYTTNTYILMIIGGGQLGVSLSYALAPMVLKSFIDSKYVFFMGVVLTAQAMFDPRVALLTVVASVLYYLFKYHDRRQLFQAFESTLISIGLALLLHLYWILPLLRSQASIARQLVEATASTVKFLSFATFEQTLSLLHPNWPENIFGKVYFMKPEFLFLPMLAFSSLLIAKKSRTVLYFSLLALLGAFLAKGINPPFGGIYLWLFENVPGFALFRDPTKFYLFPAIAFSVLIPTALEKVKKGKMASILFIIFWMFTIRQALFGQLTGTFKPAPVPQEYIALKNFLVAQPVAFQTLWIPERQRFGFASKLHPAIDARLLSRESSISGILAWISKEEIQGELATENIKYVIVPYDSRGELFLTDRKYDEVMYRATVDQLATIPWFGKLDAFSQIGVFEVLK